MLDAVARLQPGVLGDDNSSQFDSFNPALDGLLDCPHYTRPEEWEGQKAPAELLSGHHAQIERWRRDRRLEITARQRPFDLVICYDDPQSIEIKSRYARDHGLGGVMFWELSQDDEQSSLLNAIHAGLTGK